MSASSTPEPAVVEENQRLQENQRRSLELALAAVRTAAENRGKDILLLDMRKLSSLFDYFVIVTGTSRRQLHAVSEEIDRVLEQELHDHRMGIEGYSESRWIVLDYGSVVIHLFEPATREFYDLENFWAEADRVDISKILDEVNRGTAS